MTSEDGLYVRVSCRDLIKVFDWKSNYQVRPFLPPQPPSLHHKGHGAEVKGDLSLSLSLSVSHTHLRARLCPSRPSLLSGQFLYARPSLSLSLPPFFSLSLLYLKLIVFYHHKDTWFSLIDWLVREEGENSNTGAGKTEVHLLVEVNAAILLRWRKPCFCCHGVCLFTRHPVASYSDLKIKTPPE